MPSGSTRRRSVVAVGVLAVLVGGSIFVQIAVHRADGAAVLVVIEDALPARDPGAAVRRDERRADSLLLLQWQRRCDGLAVTSIPRDLVLVPRADTVSILLQTAGLAEIVDQIEGAFHVRIAATVTLDVGQVEAMARRLGPVTIDLASAARDRRTGFSGGPGPVSLDPERLIAYLRARTWEQFTDGQWQLITVSDEDRIDRLHTYLRAAVPLVEHASVIERLDLLATLARNSSIEVLDPVAAAGFALRVAAVRTTTFAVAPVLDERTFDERRSPFAPDDLEAARRLVPSPDPLSPRQCDARS
jgi:anionic cell wall polymer biosynthesis LytR-Cps2A-Psr (LCP) family protein